MSVRYYGLCEKNDDCSLVTIIQIAQLLQLNTFYTIL